MKHTPGPWTVSTCWSQTCGEGYFIAEDRQTEDEMAANARLIAAAPELLEALKNLWAEVTKYESIGHEGSNLLEVMSDARSAIAKAEVRP